MGEDNRVRISLKIPICVYDSHINHVTAVGHLKSHIFLTPTLTIAVSPSSHGCDCSRC